MNSIHIFLIPFLFFSYSEKVNFNIPFLKRDVSSGEAEQLVMQAYDFQPETSVGQKSSVPQSLWGLVRVLQRHGHAEADQVD